MLLPVFKYSKVLILIFIMQQGFDAQTWKTYTRMSVYFIELTYSHPDDNMTSKVSA